MPEPNTEMVGPKAYSYVRFSTPEQMQGDSFRRQTAAALQYAQKHGLELDNELTFQDLGVSAFRGRNARTGALRAFLDLVDEGVIAQGSFLLVESLDRISRDQILEAQGLFLQIINAGVTLVTLMDSREYSKESINANPTDLIVSIVGMMRAHEESATKARRLRSTWETKRSKAASKPMTARGPAWLMLQEGVWEVIHTRADVVRRMFEMASRGVGQHRIAETFNSEEVPTFGKAQYWHRSYVKKVLENPAVIGTHIPHKIEYRDGKKRRKPLEPIPDYFPPIIAFDLWEAVSAQRAGARRVPKMGKTGVSNLLAGLAECPLCGGSMTRVTKGKRSSGPKLICSRAKAGAGCEYRSIPQHDLEWVLVNQAGQLIGEAPAPSDETDREIISLQGAIWALEDGLEALLDAVQQNPGSRALKDRLQKAEVELDDLRVRLRRAEALHAASFGPVVRHRLKELKAALSSEPMDRSRANALLRSLLERVVVDWRTGWLELCWKHGGTSELMFAWAEREPETTKAGLQLS